MTGSSRLAPPKTGRFPAFQPSDLYKLRRCTASSGERIPLLVDAKTGLPVASVNTYILVCRRDRCQSSTIENELYALGVLLAWAEANGVDLEALLEQGKALTQGELSSLIDALRTDYRRRPTGKIVPLLRPLVEPSSWARRIVVVREYVAWRLETVLRQCEPGSLRFEHVRQQRDHFIRAINARTPASRTTANKEGLEPSLWHRLLTVTAAESVDNPFQTTLRKRNALIIEILGSIGLRKGELLKLRTSHVSTGHTQSLKIERRPDDPEDPRTNQPQVKTRDRTVPLDSRLARTIQEYILNDRRQIPNAKRSPFLFLSRSGRPLSLRGLDKIFAQIISRHSEFRGVLAPHILRHTANDRLSEVFENQSCSTAEAAEIRNYLMGWSPNSQQGTKYTRRYIEAKAQEISLEHQRRLFQSDVR